MVQILYIIAFTILSLLAVTSLIRSMIALAQNSDIRSPRNAQISRQTLKYAHPELLDADGNVTDEPLLVLRSMSIDDARSRLDAIYEASPGSDS